MIQRKSRRYKEQMKKMGPNKGIVVDSRNLRVGFINDGEEIRSPGPRENKKMTEYSNFNTEPGMTTWVDMPEAYKQAFYRQHESKKIAVQKAKETKLEQKVREKRLHERVEQMEKKLFNKDDISKEDDPDAPKKVYDYGITTSHLGGKKKKGVSYGESDAAVCNFIDTRFFEKKYHQVRKTLTIKSGRPRVLLLSDVCGWAWWNKSHYLRMHLADDYDIEIVCLVGPEARGINRGRFALYVTYGYSYVHHLQGISKNKRVTGMTAHRPLGTLRSYMEYAGHVHANSMLLYNDLKKIIKHKNIYYVPNGVDEEIFQPFKPIDKDGPLIAGHVGKRCPQKHQDDIILPAIAAAGVESTTNLNDYTIKRPYCEMAEVYQNMDVFLVASEEDGTPNPALEAAACGRPIISNRIGNMPEFIKDGYNGFLLDSMKVDKYIEKLKYLKKNRDHLIEMGKNARKTVEEGWTWKHQAENYRKMFKKCIGK